MADLKNADLVGLIFDAMQDVERYTRIVDLRRRYIAIIAEAERRGAAKEREACAEIAERKRRRWEGNAAAEILSDYTWDYRAAMAQEIRDAIRNRADKENPR